MLDVIHNGQRHVATLGKFISRTDARELAQVERAKILKGGGRHWRQEKD